MHKDDKVLLKEDFEKLVASTATKQEYSVVSMKAVIWAAKHKRRRGGITIDNEAADDHVQHPPEFDDKGSLWHRKCQLK